MKKLAIHMLGIILLSTGLNATDTLATYTIASETSESVKDSLREKKISFHKDEDGDISFEYRVNNAVRFFMLDLGISSYLLDGSLDLPADLDYLDQRLIRSTNVGIHLVNVKFDMNKKNGRSKFGISTAVKWNVVHYSMERDYRLNPDHPNISSALDFDVPGLKKNRLKANYLQIPLMLDFDSNPDRIYDSFNIAFGYVHQLLLNSNYKYKTEDGDKTKTKGEFNLRKSMGMLEGRIGYGPLNFYVQYGLSDLFQDENVPGLRPINFGVVIVPR